MEKITIQVRPEDLRYIAITCRCKHRSTAEVPEQLAKSFNAHICPNCGTMYRVTLREDGNVTGKDGRKWLVSRGPKVDDLASVSAENVMEAVNGMEQREKASCPIGDTEDANLCQSCKGSGHRGATVCGNCWGTGRKDGKFGDPVCDSSKVN